MSGLRSDGVNPLSGVLELDVTGASFSPNPEDWMLLIGGVPSPLSWVSPQRLEAPYQLEEGASSITFAAADSEGLPLELSEIFWAGSRRLDVDVVLEDGTPVSAAQVTLMLVDDPDVVLQATSELGTARFFDLPGRTFIVTARDDQGRFGTTGAVGDQAFVSLTLLDFDPPSPIDNNDLHLGTTEGWNVGTAPVEIIPHDDGSSSLVPNWDLKLTTMGEGPQTISRTFETEPGIQNVSVRYRFITSEVPGGYFGSKFNDMFSVSIRAQGSGASATESNSMNSLGLAAFDASGATDWREKSLAVKPTGDVIQVDVTVANVADGLFDSSVVVDRIAEKSLGITTLELHDIDGLPLRRLSADAHAYFGGHTRVHGRVTIEGAPDDRLSELTLEVVQAGKVAALAPVSPSAAGELFQAFGDDQKIEVATSRLLFELPSSEASKIDGGSNGTLQLRVRARSASEQTVTRDLERPVGLLVRYRGSGRYGPRNESEGGDDWGVPSLVALLDHFGESIDQVGDLSNMNGGPIAPHSTHQEGRDVDGWFNGYNARGTGAAVRFLEMLNNPRGSEIELIYVTYRRNASDDFWTMIQSVQLDDGRFARDVIRPFEGHEGHFHLRLK